MKNARKARVPARPLARPGSRARDVCIVFNPTGCCSIQSCFVLSRCPRVHGCFQFSCVVFSTPCAFGSEIPTWLPRCVFCVVEGVPSRGSWLAIPASPGSSYGQSPPPSALLQRRFRGAAGIEALRCYRCRGAGGERRHRDSPGRQSASDKSTSPRIVSTTAFTNPCRSWDSVAYYDDPGDTVSSCTWSARIGAVIRTCALRRVCLELGYPYSR